MPEASAASVAAPRRAQVLSLGSLWIAPPLLVLAILFFYPLALIVGQAFNGDEHVFSLSYIGSVLGSVQFQSAFLHTIQISMAATAGCVALGFTQIGRAHVCTAVTATSRKPSS